MQPFEYRSVRYWSKEINGTRTGGRKRKFFNSRLTTQPYAMAAAPVESCQSLPNRCPWGRLGSVLYTCNRQQRMRGRFHRWIQISTGPQRSADNYHDPPKFWIQSYLGSAKRRRMRRRRLPDHKPIPEGVREPIYIRKK